MLFSKKADIAFKLYYVYPLSRCYCLFDVVVVSSSSQLCKCHPKKNGFKWWWICALIMSGRMGLCSVKFKYIHRHNIDNSHLAKKQSSFVFSSKAKDHLLPWS